jgi:hypothetical protein
VIADPNAMSACSQLPIDLPYRPPSLNVVRGHPTERSDRQYRWAKRFDRTQVLIAFRCLCLLMMNRDVQEQRFPDHRNRFTLAAQSGKRA